MKAKQKRQEPREEIFSICSRKGWDVVHLFLRAAHRSDANVSWINVIDDAKAFKNECIVHNIPEYVWKYTNMEYAIHKKELAARQRELDRITAKRLTPLYIRASFARMRW